MDGGFVRHLVSSPPCPMDSMDRPLTTLDFARGRARPEQSAERLQTALDLVSDTVLFVDPESLRVVGANQAVRTSLGYSEIELLGLTLDDVAPVADNGGLAEAIDRVIRSEGPNGPMRSVQRRSDGTTFPVAMSLGLVDGQQDGLLVLVANAASAVDRWPDGVPNCSARDALTGLQGRTELERRLQWEAQRTDKTGAQYAILFLDVDHFKRVNDTLGHVTGDYVLRTVARRLVACLRPTDLAVRFGGDEFIALVAEIRCLEDAIQVTRRVQRAMRRTIKAPGCQVAISASIGIAMGVDGSADAERLIDGADQAMYRAKVRGRRGYFAVYDPSKTDRWLADSNGPSDVLPMARLSHSSFAPRLPR